MQKILPQVKEKSFGERGVGLVVIIGIVALIAFGGVTYIAVRNAPPRPEPGANIPTTSAEPPIKRAGNTLFTRQSDSSASLRAEMEMALKSGGINPTRLTSIGREIDALSVKGADVSTLRALLGKLSVGGSEKPKPPAQIAPPAQEITRVETKPFWEYDPSNPDLGWYWAREGVPPACPESLVLESPVDVSLATGILYPGQVRGDGPKDFKPHGGFTLKPGSKIELKAPMDGYLVSAARFTDEFGYHISLTFQNPCGIQFGGGHWGSLPPDIQAVVDKGPLKGFRESPTEPIIPPYFVKKGQVIVTGLQEKTNPERPGFDWGVADLRRKNTASEDPRFRELYGYAPWNTYYGVCWLDLLPPDQQVVLKSLPGGDYRQGKNSEYCK